MNKLINLVTTATLLIATAMVVTIIFWLTYDYKPLIINKVPLEVVNKEVKVGESLNYKLDYCKNNDNQVLINRKFIDGLVYSVPELRAKNTKGCYEMTVAVDVPHSLPEGTYKLVIDYTYEVNPIRKLTVTTETEPFVVIK